MKHLATVLGLATVGLFAAGCSGQVSVGETPKVAKQEVQKQVSGQLGKKFGREPERVNCPEDLEAKPGKTTRCTLTDRGERYGLTVKVNKVQGTKVAFGIKVDDKPMQ